MKALACQVLLATLLLACAFSIAASRSVRQQQAGTPRYSMRLDIGPLRQYWPEDHGYCGEMSLQQAAAYLGHYCSQRALRWLADGEVLFSRLEGANMWPLVNQQLGFKHTSFREVPAGGDGVAKYVLFLKKAVAAGMPAILTARIEDGESEPPEPYDHIMPLYGFTSSSLDAYDPADTLTWTTGNQEEITRSVSDPHFTADDPDSCTYDLDQGGCINSNANSNNHGLAIAGLHDSHGLYLPMQLVITSWSDGTAPEEEPRTGSVQGGYMLKLSRAGSFAAGDSFTVYRFDMVQGQQVDPVVQSGNVLANLADVSQLQAVCVRAGQACRSHQVSVQVPGTQVLSAAEQHLGLLPANSVVFFVAVRGDAPAVPSK